MKQSWKLLTCVAVSITLLSFSLMAGEKQVLSMSTTTSTQASGLLDILLPAFEKDTGIRVKVIAKGTGAAIRDGIDGNVDVIFVHAKGREKTFVDQGFGTKRYAVMHNDFVILGPKQDQAGIKGCKDASTALNKIASSGSQFISRGDDSGTHTKEQYLWRQAGLEMSKVSSTITKKGKKKTINFTQPAGSWYYSLGQGMGKVLTFADEKRAYTMSDRGTYIKYKFGRTQGIDLEILCQGDPLLHNPYGVIPVNPKKHPHVKFDLAKQYAEWIVSPKAQNMIANYTLEGQQLFYPDAMN